MGATSRKLKAHQKKMINNLLPWINRRSSKPPPSSIPSPSADSRSSFPHPPRPLPSNSPSSSATPPPSPLTLLRVQELFQLRNQLRKEALSTSRAREVDNLLQLLDGQLEARLVFAQECIDNTVSELQAQLENIHLLPLNQYVDRRGSYTSVVPSPLPPLSANDLLDSASWPSQEESNHPPSSPLSSCPSSSDSPEDRTQPSHPNQRPSAPLRLSSRFVPDPRKLVETESELEADEMDEAEEQEDVGRKRPRRGKKQKVEVAPEGMIRSTWVCSECEGEVEGDLMTVHPVGDVEPRKTNEAFVYRSGGTPDEAAKAPVRHIDFPFHSNLQQTLASALRNAPPPIVLPFRLREQAFRDEFLRKIPHQERFKNILSQKVVKARLTAYLKNRSKWVREARVILDCSELVDLDGEGVAFFVDLPADLADQMRIFKTRYTEVVEEMMEVDARYGWQIRATTHMFVWLSKGGSRPELVAVHRETSKKFNAKFTELAREIARWLDSSLLTYLQTINHPLVKDFLRVKKDLHDTLLHQNPDFKGLVSLLGCTLAAWIQDTQRDHRDVKDVASGVSMVVTQGTSAGLEIRLIEANVRIIAPPNCIFWIRSNTFTHSVHQIFSAGESVRGDERFSFASFEHATLSVASHAISRLRTAFR